MNCATPHTVHPVLCILGYGVFVDRSNFHLLVTYFGKEYDSMTDAVADFCGAYLWCTSSKARYVTYANLNFTTEQVKCLKNRDISVTSTSAENTGAFINITPAKALRLVSSSFQLSYLFFRTVGWTFSHFYIIKLAVILFCIKRIYRWCQLITLSHHYCANCYCRFINRIFQV